MTSKVYTIPVEAETQKNKFLSSVAHAKRYFISIIAQTLICVVGFLVLNRSLGDTISNSMVTTIVLSVGSVSGQIIMKPKDTLVDY